MSYPYTRLRRNRSHPWVREMLTEHRLHPSDFVWPCFVCEGEGVREPIKTMPGVARLSIDLLVEKVKEAAKLGIPAVALFPVVPEHLKCEKAKEAYKKDNLVCRAVKAIKQEVPEIGVICDVALDPYTSHGQDGIVVDNYVANDETVEVLVKQALTLAEAGADVVAPSDMMDGRIGAIRTALEQEGYTNVKILSYAVKYASSFYGPFRDAVGSAANLGRGGKQTYQMNPAGNIDEALREVEQDLEEGADMVMVKPGLPYLDVITQVKAECRVPVLAYQVSGEYAMLKFAGEAGALDEEKSMLEALLAFKRAGASAIFTYAAIEVAKQIITS